MKRTLRNVWILALTLGVGLAVPACPSGAGSCSFQQPIQERVTARGFPSVFQAGNPIDMTNAFPRETLEGRLKAAAKHDVLWEEPVSQVGSGIELVLGPVWDHLHAGLATNFTEGSLKQALENRRALLALNPNMVFLLSIRWRDAPETFLPENSAFWKRDKNDKRIPSAPGGTVPWYQLDFENPAFVTNVARQAKIAAESGVYDGILLDAGGYLPLVKAIREAIGEQRLILVNIRDDIEAGLKYKDLINGAYMECNPEGPGAPKSNGATTWDKLRKALLFFSRNLREPRVNCLEVPGERTDRRRMRATTTLALTHSNGSVLYADPNSLKTPDHLHDWYPFWDAKVGKPTGDRIDRLDGLFQREFEHGTVFYNPLGNNPVTVTFETPHKRVSDGTTGTRFTLQDCDGDIFLPAE